MIELRYSRLPCALDVPCHLRPSLPTTMVYPPCSMFLLACTIAVPAGVLGFTIDAPSTVPFEGSMSITWLTEDGDPPSFSILIIQSPPVSSNELVAANQVNSTDGTFTIASLPSSVTPAKWQLAFAIKFVNDQFFTVLDSTDFEVLPTSGTSPSSSLILPAVPASAITLSASSFSTTIASGSSASSQLPTATESTTTTTELYEIVGGAAGGLALLLVGGLFVWWCVRRRQRRQHQRVDHDVEDGTNSFFPDPVTRTPFTSGMPVLQDLGEVNNNSVQAFFYSPISTIHTEERSISPANSTTAMSPSRASSRVLTSSFSPPRPPPIPNSNRSRQTVLEDQVRRLQFELRALRLGHRGGRNPNRTGTGGSGVSNTSEM
ncbi:hypothetical protein FB45DRAFT_466787 [Roridomyces roridus]|uniref:Mid2 domain-containing protein n=1 Tax=Roridomyces roridus TaxID=1738132 RepID=A0AAD7BZW0_9AGAR|nr:hypothetical protein FB45DRAFT_466787 [Roridomyces roridus]